MHDEDKGVRRSSASLTIGETTIEGVDLNDIQKQIESFQNYKREKVTDPVTGNTFTVLVEEVAGQKITFPTVEAHLAQKYSGYSMGSRCPVAGSDSFFSWDWGAGFGSWWDSVHHEVFRRLPEELETVMLLGCYKQFSVVRTSRARFSIYYRGKRAADISDLLAIDDAPNEVRVHRAQQLAEHWGVSYSRRRRQKPWRKKRKGERW
jgi:hypothetical protein